MTEIEFDLWRFTGSFGLLEKFMFDAQEPSTRDADMLSNLGNCPTIVRRTKIGLRLIQVRHSDSKPGMRRLICREDISSRVVCHALLLTLIILRAEGVYHSEG